MRRGYSLLSGVLSVTALVIVLLAPLSLNRLRDELGRFELSAIKHALVIARAHLSLQQVVRVLRCRNSSLPASGYKHVRWASRPTAGQWHCLKRGLCWRTVRVTGMFGDPMQVYEVHINPRVAALNVVYHHPQAVAEAGRVRHALVAINACYFDQDRRPLGYLKIDGRVINRGVASGAAFTGVFTLRGHKARIVSRAAFDGHCVDTALQAGPRLIANGAPTRGLQETRSFRQSGVAVTRQGNIVLYVTGGSFVGLTWQQMQAILAGPSSAGGIDARDVLNLDGGSSSQIYVRTGKGPGIATGFPTRVPVILTAH